MNKPRSLRIPAIAAALLSLLGIALNIIMVLNPHIAAIILGYGGVNDIMEASLSADTAKYMIIQAVIPAALTLICAVNIFSDNVSRGRSLMTLICVPVVYILISAASSYVYTLSLRSAMAEGISTVQLVSAITSVRSVLSYLQVFAFVMIMCAASVEHYIAGKSER